MSSVNWIGHWKGEDRREEWVTSVASEFARNYPNVRVNLRFAQDIVGEKSKRKSAEHLADMLLAGRRDWDVIWLDDFIYSFVAGLLKDPFWGRKHLVDFEQVPGFRETHKSFIFDDPSYRSQTGGMIVGPYVEGYLYVLWYNRNLADELGLKVKEDGMTFDDFLSYVARVHEYNKAHKTNYAALFETHDWVMCQNIFQSLLKSEFSTIAEANSEVPSPVKLAALRKTLQAFEQLGRHRPLIRAHDTRVWFQTRGDVLDDKALFYPNGTWMFSHWAEIDRAKMGRMMPALLPTFRPVDHGLGGFVPTWAVLRDAPNQELGIRLLMTMCQPRFAEMWVEYTKNPTAIRGDPERPLNSDDPYERIQARAQGRFGSRLGFSSNPAYFLGTQNALLEGAVNHTLLNLLDGRIAGDDAFSLIQSKTAPTGHKRSLAFTVALGVTAQQLAILLGASLLFSAWLSWQGERSNLPQWDAVAQRLGQLDGVGFLVAGGVSALSVSVALILYLRRTVIRPLNDTLAVVQRVAGGEQQQRIAVLRPVRDEISELQRGINAMIDVLESNVRDVQHAILENVEEGFFRVGRDGQMSIDRSAVLESWFGEVEGPCCFTDYIRRVDPERAGYLAIAWDQLIDGVLPLDVLIEQLPSRIRAGALTLALRYRPVLEDRRIRELIVVVSDVTAEVEREKAEAEAQRLLGIVRILLKDRGAFMQFVREGSRLVRSITGGSLHGAELARAIHTLKGNAAMFELSAVAELCHTLESELLAGDPVARQQLEKLQELWSPVEALAGSSLEVGTASALEVTQAERDAVLSALTQGAPREEIAQTIIRWSWEPVSRHFRRYAERANALAKRLGKAPIEVIVEDHGLRLPNPEWSGVWAALVHLLPNAIDHGLEPSEERVRAGKRPAGRLTLSAQLDRGEVLLVIEDDGRGIDWEAIRVRAAELGLPSETRQDLVAALFSDGVSTRSVATEVSGRGVGLAALKAACLALGGRIEVISERGLGTRFELRVPLRRAEAARSGLIPLEPSGAFGRAAEGAADPELQR